MFNENDHPVCYCYLCDEPIFPDQEHYHMPDGADVCVDCLKDWAEEYKIPGVVMKS